MLELDLTALVVNGADVELAVSVSGLGDVAGVESRLQGQGSVVVAVGVEASVVLGSLVPFAGTEHSAGLVYPSQSSSFHVPAG